MFFVATQARRTWLLRAGTFCWLVLHRTVATRDCPGRRAVAGPSAARRLASLAGGGHEPLPPRSDRGGPHRPSSFAFWSTPLATAPAVSRFLFGQCSRRLWKNRVGLAWGLRKYLIILIVFIVYLVWSQILACLRK